MRYCSLPFLPDKGTEECIGKDLSMLKLEFRFSSYSNSKQAYSTHLSIPSHCHTDASCLYLAPGSSATFLSEVSLVSWIRLDNVASLSSTKHVQLHCGSTNLNQETSWVTICLCISLSPKHELEVVESDRYGREAPRALWSIIRWFHVLDAFAERNEHSPK